MTDYRRGAGFQKPAADPANARPVGLAMITTQGFTTSCSCGGFAKSHMREKVREEAAQRHLDRRHGGQGVWL